MLHLAVVLVTSSATMTNNEAVDDVSKVVFFFVWFWKYWPNFQI
jgi:hypothetical protein